jgi:PAS domain S-box-containing protein
MAAERIRVLFVDDEENNLKAFKSTFRRDLDIHLASSGPEALEILDRENVHVIISDQRMPGMSGSEFLAIARERYPEKRRILLTGYSDLEAVIAAVNQGGIHAYATKPWDANDLLLRIKQTYQILQLQEESAVLLQRYCQVFNTSADPIILVDRRARIIDANGACAKLVGVPLKELIGSRFTEHIENARTLVASLRSQQTLGAGANIDLTLHTRNGKVIDCLMTSTYLGKGDHGVDVFQAMIKDISDRKQQEERLRKLNSDLDKRVAVRTAQLMEALEDLGSFSYTVAHDLRSPLKNIVALCEHLSSHVEGSDMEVTALTNRIHKGAQRMIELVDDLLRFSQTNTRELELRRVHLHPLVQDLVAELTHTDRRGQVHIEIAPDACVLADASMLKVVLQNILSNALKFSRHTLEPRIVIAHRRENGRDLITVQDNGVGFDAAHKQQVFGAFKRLHKQEQFEGTGVGLAIVHRIVGKHGGEVWADSELGKGTTIHVSLPSEAVEQSPGFFGRVA